MWGITANFLGLAPEQRPCPERVTMGGMKDGDGSPGDGAVQRSDASPAEAAPAAPSDRLLVHSQSEQGYRVVRQRGDQIELGELRGLQDGKPISGEMISLRPTDHERVFDVETVHASPARAAKGPPMVATSTYRTGWDAVFGSEKPEVKPAEVDPKLLN